MAACQRIQAKPLVLLLMLSAWWSSSVFSQNILKDAYQSMQKKRDQERLKNRKLRFASESADRGKALMSLCLACHSVVEGEPSRGSDPRIVYVGPNLFGVVDRPIASLKDYQYSPALHKLKTKKWSPRELARFIRRPHTYAPGNKMKFEGVLDPQDRIDIINYLKTLK